MTDLPCCPCCNGILNVPRHYRLTSACRCGFPAKVTWADFPNEQLTVCEGDPLLKAKRRRAA